ncbi:MAG: hydrogen gas-evolving membrane-bound hydrogenase subunit E, partial [Actinomycetota bacterium]
AKEKALDGLLDNEIGAVGVVALVGIAVGSVLTVAYTIRIAVGLLGDDAPGVDAADPHVVPDVDPAALQPIEPTSLHRPSLAFVAAPALLATASLAAGIAAGPVGDWLAEATASLDEKTATKELKLYPGINTALLLSTVIIAAGVLVWWFSRTATRTVDARQSLATVWYDRMYDGLLAGARRTTVLTQSGSLPFYLAVVLTTLGAALGAALIAGATDAISDPRFSNSPLEFVVVLVTGVLAVGVLASRTRFGAAVLLGGSGYALAVVYLIQGAPDLAITQFLVETLTIVVFLLVLARLPSNFSPAPSWAPRLVRIAIAVLVGVTMSAFALSATGSRTEESVGSQYVELSEPEAGGDNVVNVILVDFRGFDTMGEIAVLAVAGAGVVNLVRAARRQQRRRQIADGMETDDGGESIDQTGPIGEGEDDGFSTVRQVGVWR